MNAVSPGFIDMGQRCAEGHTTRAAAIGRSVTVSFSAVVLLVLTLHR